VKVLKEVEGCRQVMEVCRDYGISGAVYYNWKAKYGGRQVSDIKRLKGPGKRMCDANVCLPVGVLLAYYNSIWPVMFEVFCSVVYIMLHLLILDNVNDA
jgi:Transposase